MLRFKKAFIVKKWFYVLVLVENGIADYCSTYTLEYEWEVAVGTWQFSIAMKGKDILRQTFELYK